MKWICTLVIPEDWKILFLSCKPTLVETAVSSYIFIAIFTTILIFLSSYMLFVQKGAYESYHYDMFEWVDSIYIYIYIYIFWNFCLQEKQLSISSSEYHQVCFKVEKWNEEAIWVVFRVYS